MRRTRICQLITELELAGAERCVYELARRLDRRRFDVQVVALRGGRVADMLTAAGVEVTVLGVRWRLDLPKFLRLVNLLRRARVDILHTHLFHADLIGRAAAALAGVPHLLHTVHVAEGRFRPWQFAYARFFAERCERIVCVSESVRDYHARASGLPRWRYIVIPNGTDIESFSSDPAARKELRRQWRIGPREVLLAFVGRLDHQKGIDRLLGAVSHLGARGEHVNLVVAGDGPKRDLVENFIRHGEGGRFARLLGFVEDVRGVLSAADVFVMPSRWEGFGLAAAEAMAAGLPVIATKVPGLREVVVDGQTGVLVAPDDVQTLAEAILQLVGDRRERRRLGEAGRARVAEQFAIASNVAAHERLYAEVAAGGRMTGRFGSCPVQTADA